MLLPELSDEQKVRRGVLAGKYLDDADFMSFIDEMRALLLTCIGNTTPDDHQTRTSLYYQHLGLVDLVAHLETYRQTAIQIHEVNDAEQEALLDEFNTFGAD